MSCDQKTSPGLQIDTNIKAGAVIDWEFGASIKGLVESLEKHKGVVDHHIGAFGVRASEMA